MKPKQGDTVLVRQFVFGQEALWHEAKVTSVKPKTMQCKGKGFDVPVEIDGDMWRRK